MQARMMVVFASRVVQTREDGVADGSAGLWCRATRAWRRRREGMDALWGGVSGCASLEGAWGGERVG